MHRKKTHQVSELAIEKSVSVPEVRSIVNVPNAFHINDTPFPSQYFQSVDKDGEIYHTLVTCISYDMRSKWGEGYLSYAAIQRPLAVKDVWDGEPNRSTPLWESDFAPIKLRCDILVANAISRPPVLSSGQPMPVSRWLCGIALDWESETGELKHWHKHLVVTGAREFGLLGLGDPRLTKEVPIHWQLAYGGEFKEPLTDIFDGRGDTKQAAGASHWIYDERNPVGCGLLRSKGAPAPQLELTGLPYEGQKTYSPVSLCALGRSWLPRRPLAGTYDQKWLDQQWPLPPLDFDDAYWNCAPQDQQTGYLPPKTEIRLHSLFPPDPDQSWAAEFDARLPPHQLCASVRIPNFPQIDKTVHLYDLDTLVIDMAEMQIYATYRMVLHAPDVQTLKQEEKPENWRLLFETYMAPDGKSLEEHVTAEDMGILD